MRYQAILIDALNLLYRVQEQKYDPSLVSTKYVYKNLIIRYISFIEQLQEEFLTEDGKIYLLMDPSPSRHDFSKTYRNIGRKAIYSRYKENRAKESKEFYNSFDLIKYYYLAYRPVVASLQTQNMEADDLVKPVLDTYVKKGDRALLVTNDYDWTRYLSDSVDWMPKLGQVAGIEEFIEKKGYKPTETSVVIYKAIFGDTSDGIPHLLPENKQAVDEVLEMLKDEHLTVEELLTRTYHTKNLKESKVLTAIHDNEKQFRINVQLISALPMEENHLRAITCEGRNSSVVIDAVETAIGMRKEKREFVFGNIRHSG